MHCLALSSIHSSSIAAKSSSEMPVVQLSKVEKFVPSCSMMEKAAKILAKAVEMHGMPRDLLSESAAGVAKSERSTRVNWSVLAGTGALSHAL
tara:strand:- start:200 stop:478 length:279 start_codon:yes stop_codon:yes gene_type:complete